MHQLRTNYGLFTDHGHGIFIGPKSANGPCFVTGQHVIDLIVGVKRHINPCGPFCVVSQRSQEIVEEMKERNRGERKMNEIEETEEIKTFPFYLYLLQG